MTEERIRLEGDNDVVAAWKSGLVMGRRLGFGAYKQACLSGAILEFSRDMVARGEKGVCVISDESDGRMLRARVTLEGVGQAAALKARERLNADMNIGPGQPAVKLSQIVESYSVESNPDSARIVLTFNQIRAAARGRLPACA